MADSTAIKEFMAVTGADDATARFFLESANGQLETAVATYMQEEEGKGLQSQTQMPGEYNASDQGPPPGPSRKGKSKATPSRGGIGTLGSLQQNDTDDDDEKPAEFYTGGEKSGLGVIDPSKKKKGDAQPPNNNNIIQEILKKAASGGRSEPETEPRKNTFKGSGYTLGGEDEESRKIEDPNEVFQQAMARRPPKVTRVLKLWKNGFSVDDGTLYRYDDPANKKYLDAINNGTAPLSLLNVEYGQAVDVDVEKRIDEDYTPPPKVYKPFEGSGHRLGSEVPPTESPAATSSSAATQTALKEETEKMSVDESKPVTSLQIRLAAGGRLSSQFNNSHTLADVYDFISRAHPTDRPYILLTPFPRKEYPRDSTTLEEAGLLKGMLQQKFL